ncbi:MAG: hypothetical protein HY012_08365, partial [Acidobacteria bacterium]|nr:hypothetical protein [Acidobacteriota bacterium]
MENLKVEKNFYVVLILLLLLLSVDVLAQTKETAEEKPSTALASALAAACRQNETIFLRYQTAENSVAFRKLTPSQKSDLMKRIVQTGDAGRPLLSSGAEGRTVLRCETTGKTTELRFGAERIQENLAFVPVEATGGQSAEFGMVREGGGWKMLSVGLVLMNIPELAKRWATPETTAGDAENSEAAAIVTLRRLAEAVETYKKGFGKLPTQLAQLGPERRGEVSPEKANLIEQELAEGTKGGYVFAYRIVPAQKPKDAKETAGESTEPTYALTATPAEYGRT